MSSSVIIRKNGFYQRKWFGNERKWKIRRIRGISILARLREGCEIEEGVTLGDIFKIVNANKYLKTFIRCYSWCNSINELHENALETWRLTEEDLADTDVKYLEVYWHVENNEYKHDKSFGLYSGFHGIGDSEQYSMSLTPAYKMVHLPVKLNTKVTIYKPFDSKNYKERLLMESNTSYSLLEALDAIYDDLSFYGGEEQKKETIDMLNDRLDSMKDEEGVPIEKILKGLGAEVDENNELNKMKILIHPEVLNDLNNIIPLNPKKDADQEN